MNSTDNLQPDIKTELESENTRPVPLVDNMHQFADKGLHYQHKTSNTLLLLAAFIMIAVVVGYFLLNTSQGRQLLNRVNLSSTSSSTATIPDSFASSSSLSPSTSSKLEEKFFASASNQEILGQMTADITALAEKYDSKKLFPNFDPQAEVGVEGKSGNTAD